VNNLLGLAVGVRLGAFSACVLLHADRGLRPIGEARTDGLQHLSVRQLATILPIIDTDSW